MFNNKNYNYNYKYLKYKSKYLNIKAGAKKTKFDPYKCLCDSIADKYIELLKSKKIKIMNKKRYIPTYSKNLAKSSIKNIAINILKDMVSQNLSKNNMTNFFKNKQNLPYFYSLNLIWSNKDDKHSMYLIFDYDENLKQYIIELFDSNGPLNETELEGKEYQNIYPNEYNVWKSVEFLCDIIYEYIGEKPIPIEVLKEGHNINTCGDGHCDALSLFYVTLRKNSNNYEEAVEKLNKYLPKHFSEEIIALINTKIKDKITQPGLPFITDEELEEINQYVSSSEEDSSDEEDNTQSRKTTQPTHYNIPKNNLDDYNKHSHKHKHRNKTGKGSRGHTHKHKHRNKNIGHHTARNSYEFPHAHKKPDSKH